MTSNRPYRRRRSWEDAAEEIVRFSGSQFDPDVVAGFRGVDDELRDIRDRLAAFV